ncbi:MAG: hypothetical protein KDJ99_15055 [Candidatus Competibacteraceae bacterium]|nr:hypothetical protein [Candidatus Competibacteraceae bacterium]
MRPSLVVIVSLWSTLYSANATQAEQLYADTQLLVGRYSAYRASPSFEQRHPLAQIITFSFPLEHVHTVGQAIQQLLLGSGSDHQHSQFEIWRAPAVFLWRLPANLIWVSA